MSWRNQTSATFRAMSVSRKPIRILKMAYQNQLFHDGFADGVAGQHMNRLKAPCREYQIGYDLGAQQ